MQLSHGGPSLLSLALLHCGNYLALVTEMKARAMFDTHETQPVVIDVLQIEAEARRMRAEVIAAGFAALKAKIVTLFASSAQPKAQH